MSEQKNIRPVSLDDAMERVKYYLREFTANSLKGTRTGAVLEDVTGSSGKMIRPRLLVLCSAFGPYFPERSENICKLAAMVEMTHMASLIHDDIIDEAPFRRGRPSIQKKYGKDAAVYAGDFLIARVHYRQAREGLNHAAMILSETVEKMCIGEIGQAMYRYDEKVTKEQYLRNIRGKTAALFKAACVIGAMESGCDDDITKFLGKLGETMGMIFQLRDDLLDFSSDKEHAGKETHKDFFDGIYTMPVLLAADSPEAGETIIRLMKENAVRRLDQDEIRLMEQTVLQGGGTEATMEMIRGYTSTCRELLDALAGNGTGKDDGPETAGEFRQRQIKAAGTIRKMLDRFDEF